MNKINNYRGDVEEVIKVLKDRIPNKVSSIYLTGSRLYGINTVLSDIDLVVYVLPTKEDIISNNLLSKEVNINMGMVESIKVRDVRLVLKELLKPTLNSLHLLTEPIYGLPAMKRSIVEESFEIGKKNLFLSILAYAGKAVNSNEAKDKIRGMLFYTIYSEFDSKGIHHGFFDSYEYVRKSSLLKIVRNDNIQELIEPISKFSKDIDDSFKEEVKKTNGGQNYLIPEVVEYVSNLLKDEIVF